MKQRQVFELSHDEVKMAAKRHIGASLGDKLIQIENGDVMIGTTLNVDTLKNACIDVAKGELNGSVAGVVSRCDISVEDDKFAATVSFQCK